MAFDILGYAPEKTESSEEDDDEYESSSEGDPYASVNYKNESYWAIQENLLYQDSQIRISIPVTEKKTAGGPHAQGAVRARKLHHALGTEEVASHAGPEEID